MHHHKTLNGLLAGFGLLLSLLPLVAAAAPITYYDLDFEDGTLGGGTGLPVPSTNVSPSNLDGRALEFALGNQVGWLRNAADSTTHYIRFDYWAAPGGNITQFLDTPTILRLDVDAVGRHRVEVYYDLAVQTATALLDGVVDNSLLTILAWSMPPGAMDVRIANQQIGPGYSTDIFQIDNFLWQGNVDIPRFDGSRVPEPSLLVLLGVGLAGMRLVCRRRRGSFIRAT